MYRDRVKVPRWHQIDAILAVRESGHFPEIQNILGSAPQEGSDGNCALGLSERIGDPNAGKAPRDMFDVDQTDYEHPFFPTETGGIGVRDWANGLSRLHIGGTMSPGQNMPRFSPYYIEFEQYFVGFNFAHGTGELDSKEMIFDVIR